MGKEKLGEIQLYSSLPPFETVAWFAGKLGSKTNWFIALKLPASTSMRIKEMGPGISPVLRTGRDLPVDGEVVQERLDLGHTYLLRVFETVKADVPFEPLDISLLGANRRMQEPQLGPNSVEQLRRFRSRRGQTGIHWMRPGGSVRMEDENPFYFR